MEGTSWVCHSISNGSELYPGAVESDRSCAAVYGPDSLQEKWLGFFLLSFSVGFLFSLHKFAQPSFTRAWSKAQSTAWLALTGPFLPGNGKELANTRAGASHHPQLTGRALPRAAGAQHRASIGQEVPGRHRWQSMSSVSPSLLPLQQLSGPVPPALPHLPGVSASTETEHPQRASTFSACLVLPGKLQPSHSKPLGTGHLALSLG